MMTEHEQQIAVAEVCGWTYKNPAPVGEQWDGYACWIRPDGFYFCTPPDYLHDLNAMHEAETILDDAQCRVYNELLCKMCVPLGALFPPFPERRCEMYMFHATAAQRAEAFLRTVGKWKDS